MRLRGKSEADISDASYRNNELFGLKPSRKYKTQKKCTWEEVSRRDFLEIAGVGAGAALIVGLSPTVEFLNKIGSLVEPKIAYAADAGPLEDGYYTIHPLGYTNLCLGIDGINDSAGNALRIQSFSGSSRQEFRFDRTTTNTTASNVYTIEPSHGWMRCLTLGMKDGLYTSGNTILAQTRIQDCTYQRFYIGLKTSTSGQSGYIIVPEGKPGFALTWSSATKNIYPSITARDDGNTTGIFSDNQLWVIKQTYSVEYSAPSTTWKSAESMPFLSAEYAACRLTEDSATISTFGYCYHRTYVDSKDSYTSKYGYFFTGRNGGITLNNVGYDADGDAMSIKITMLAMRGWNYDGCSASPTGSSYPAVAFLDENLLTRWEPDDAGNTYIGFQLETWCAEARIKMEWIKTGTSNAANCKIAGTFSDVDIAQNNSSIPRWSGCEGVSIPLQASTIYSWSSCILVKDKTCGGVHIPTGTTLQYNTLGYNKKTMVHFTTEQPYLIVEYSGAGCGTRFDFYYPNIVPGTPVKSAAITST
jgi:hypothetical protein